MPRNPRQTKTVHRLSEECAEEVARRLDRLEDLITLDRPFTLDDWESLTNVLLPEVYGEPESEALWPSWEAPGSPAKASLLYQRSLCQVSLWHAQDPTDYPGLADLLIPLFATKEQRKEWRRLKAAKREPKRQRPKEEQPAEVVKRKRRKHWHQGMIRFDDVADECAGREYDPAEWTRRGDATSDGEVNAKRRRCHASSSR